MSNHRQFWKIEMTVWADSDQVNELTENIELLLCPDPDHQPPCPIPWEIGLHEIDDSEDEVESLRNQVEIEYP